MIMTLLKMNYLIM